MYNDYSDYDNVQRLIDSCNILLNKDPGPFGLINTYRGKAVIINSCILGNIAKNQVNEELGQFGSMISNCTIDFTSSDVSSGVTIANTPSFTFINKIACLSMQKCEASYDSFGSITVIPSSITCGKRTCNCQMWMFEKHRLRAGIFE